MKKLIIIVGPTASGKSSLALKIAKDFNLSIINADAFQVYKELNAGINKPTSDELKQIKHFFINSKSIYDEWHLKKFKDEVYELIDNSDEDTFVVCGGSNLYIDAIIKNYHLVDVDETLEYKNFTNQALHDKLKLLDHEEAQKISVNNRKRLEQALRIIESNNNQKKSEMDKNNFKPKYRYILISTNCSREFLYEKINSRVIEMINLGWKEELKNLLIKDQNLMNLNSLKAIGYKEVYDAIIFDKEIDIESIKKKTRNYAKRQITWIKNKFNVDIQYNGTNYNEIKNFIEGFLNE